ncbi:MAG: YaaC family protein [Pseudomonadota bacterium]
MAAPELRIKNRACYFRKSISTPSLSSERVLARDAFEFALLWLKRHCKEAVPYWEQARAYYQASGHLPAESSPLTSYYCFLNAVKALLIVKGQKFSDRHGVSGDFESSKRALVNEQINFQGGGVIAALSRYLKEAETENVCNLKDVLSNLPFIHRAFRHTFTSHSELFIPVRNVVYRKHPDANYVWLSADVDGRFADGRAMRTLPDGLERDGGYDDRCVVRTKRRVRWHGHGADDDEKRRALARLKTFHRKCRRDFTYISASPDLWYIKRSISGAKSIKRYNLTLIIAAMHRLSELSRYDPKGLKLYLEGKDNWLLTEFIELSPIQFVDELVCEMTSLEFSVPGVRPRG